MADLFVRSPDNPILTPSGAWWDARGVLNPGAAVVDGRVALVYRAVGADGLSRFGLARSADGESIDEQGFYYEPPPGDPSTRLGVEDPRLTPLDGSLYLTYTKVSVGPATEPPLPWEFAPFVLRSAVARATFGISPRSPAGEGVGGAGIPGRRGRARQEPAPATDSPADPNSQVAEVGTILADTNTKDSVLFPTRIDGRYAALVREYPSMQYTSSADLRTWSEPVTVMEPIPGTWEGERIGAGPPPMITPWGWLLLYHGNEYVRQPGNRRLYRMGLAVLDREKSWQVRYRHPEPIFEPAAPYEIEGPVGNVVFGTGLIERGEKLYLYYGAGDGVIGLATASRATIFSIIEGALGPSRG